MKINKDDFSQFLKLCNLKGEIENKEILLVFEKNKISVKAASGGKVVITNGNLNGTFEDWGSIGLYNLSLIKNFVDSSSEKELTVEKKDNKITFKSKTRKLTTSITKPEYILNQVPKNIFENLRTKASENCLKIEPSVLKEIISNFGIINSSSVILSLKDKKLNTRFETESNSLDLDFEIGEKAEDFENVEISKFFVDLLGVINDYENIILSIKEESPIYLKAEKNNCEFEYIVAPKIKTKETKKEE